MTILADPRALADQAIAAAFKPPDRIDYLRFAEDNIVFGPGEPRPGPWSRRAAKTMVIDEAVTLTGSMNARN